jgi:hypothetical protein
MFNNQNRLGLPHLKGGRDGGIGLGKTCRENMQIFEILGFWVTERQWATELLWHMFNNQNRLGLGHLKAGLA